MALECKGKRKLDFKIHCQAGMKDSLSDPTVPRKKGVAQRIKVSLKITR